MTDGNPAWAKAQKIIELLSGAGVLCLFLFLILRWPFLPDTVPSHYDAAGLIDAWKPKSSLWFPAGACAALYGVLTAVSFFPRLWNLPVNVTDANRARVLSRTRTLLCLLKLEMVALLGYITLQAAHGQPLGALFLPAVLPVIFGTLAVSLVRIIKGAKP
jgi:hypothetical protein